MYKWGRIKCLILTAGFLLIVLGTRVCAHEFELADIKNAMSSRHLKWVAGETSVSSLAPEARSKRVRLFMPVLTSQEHLQAEGLQTALQAVASAPATLDWRTNGGNFVTPVRDQGNCGSCWAFATAGALESQVLLTQKLSGKDENLAEQILVSCSGLGDCDGGPVDSTSDFIRDVGLPLESCFPYTATNNSCSHACADWRTTTYRIDSWSWVATTSPTVDALKNALYTYGPLVTTMQVYSDFFYYKSGIYHHVSGGYEGGHGVLLVGFDDNQQCFIVKNSWGARWGESGYFRIAYSELTSTVKFGYYTIHYTGGSGGGGSDDGGGGTTTFEAESLTIDNSSGDATSILNDSNLSGGKALLVNSNAVGDHITLRAPNVASGTYNVRVRVKEYGTRGIVQTLVGDAGGRLSNLGSKMDLYYRQTNYAEFDLGTLTLGPTSDKDFQFKVTGKNRRSSGYTMCIDTIKLIKQ